MLLSFTLKNYRSFRDEAVLDLQKRSFTTNRPKNDLWARATQRVAAVFGANAAGKSNILRPLGVLANAVSGSVMSKQWIRQLQDPHRTRIDEPTAFSVEYVANNIRYRWSLEISEKGIRWEKLEANPSGHWRGVFVRVEDQVRFGPHSGIPRGAQENINELVRPWVLTLSAWKLMKNMGVNAPAVSWWMNSINVLMPSDSEQAKRHEDLLGLVAVNPNWLRAAQLVMASADVGISKVRIKERDVPQELRDIARRLNEVVAEGIAEAGLEISYNIEAEALKEVLQYLEFSHTSEDGSFELDERDESLGTRSWFDLAIPALSTLAVGGVLAVDEIDSSLHPVLLRQLVEMFTDETINVGAGQIIFTSHDLTLVGNHPEPAVAKDSAWLVEKNHACSELIAWDEFPIRIQHNLEKRYFQGRYGAIPMPDMRFMIPAIKELQSEILSVDSGNGVGN